MVPLGAHGSILQRFEKSSRKRDLWPASCRATRRSVKVPSIRVLLFLEVCRSLWPIDLQTCYEHAQPSITTPRLSILNPLQTLVSPGLPFGKCALLWRAELSEKMWGWTLRCTSKDTPDSLTFIHGLIQGI